MNTKTVPTSIVLNSSISQVSRSIVNFKKQKQERVKANLYGFWRIQYNIVANNFTFFTNPKLPKWGGELFVLLIPRLWYSYSRKVHLLNRFIDTLIWFRTKASSTCVLRISDNRNILNTYYTYWKLIGSSRMLST